MWSSRERSKKNRAVKEPKRRLKLAGEKHDLRRWQRWRRKLRAIGLRRDGDYVLENLSMLLESGMDVLSALDALSSDVARRNMKLVMSEVTKDIRSGFPMWRALERAYIFPEEVISLIRIGEETGKLPENLTVIVEQQEKDRVYQSKMRAAMLYPVLVSVIATVVAVGMAWFVLPRLVSVFAQLDIELPLATRMLVNLAEFLQAHGNVAIPAMMGLMVLLLYVLFGLRYTRWIGQALLLRTPGIGRLLREAELARLGYVLGTLLEAGLPIMRALDSLQRTTRLYAYRRLIGHLKTQIDRGLPWREALRTYRGSRRLIPISIQQLIVAGDTSGRLPETLLKIGRTYEVKTDSTAKNLTVVLEPILLVIVWIGVAAVAMAIIMPIYGLVGGFNSRQQGGAVRVDEQVPGSEELVVDSPETSLSPSPSLEATPSPTPEPVPRLQITDTPTGTLNVREGPSLNDPVITQVTPGEEFVQIGESGEGDEIWYQIILSQDEQGWIFGQYAEFVDDEE